MEKKIRGSVCDQKLMGACRCERKKNFKTPVSDSMSRLKSYILRKVESQMGMPNSRTQLAVKDLTLKTLPYLHNARNVKKSNK